MKNLKKTGEKEKLKRGEFENDLEQLWDISSPKVDQVLKCDRLHNKESRAEDIAFLQDQQGDRKMEIGEVDDRYNESFKKASERKVEEENRILMLPCRRRSNNRCQRLDRS